MSRSLLMAISLIMMLPWSSAQGQGNELTTKQRLSASATSSAAKLMQKKEYERGIKFCDSAIRNDDTNVEAYWMRGLGYLKLEKPDRAIIDFTSAIKRDAKHAPSYRDRGIALVMKKQFTQAIADLTKYINLRPDDAYGYHERSLAYEAAGNKQLAAADKKKAESLERTNRSRSDGY